MRGQRLFKTTYHYRFYYDGKGKYFTSGELCVTAKTMREATSRAISAAKRSAKADAVIFLRVASLVDQGVIH